MSSKESEGLLPADEQPSTHCGCHARLPVGEQISLVVATLAVMAPQALRCQRAVHHEGHARAAGQGGHTPS